MREIAFRAWDEANKEFTLFDSIYEFQKWNRHEEEMPMYQVTQYTGLKDVNGKRIFEGDIVYKRVRFPGNEYNHFIDELDVSYIGEIVITASKGVCLKNAITKDNLETNGKWSKLGWYKPCSSVDAEIIGNIYENPELLETP